MNIFQELANFLKDNPDVSDISFTRADAERMVESAEAMNKKADIVRQFYINKYESTTTKGE